MGGPVQKVFAVFDLKACSFSTPFFCVNAGVAIRMFQRAVNDPQTDLNRFPGDYELYEVGTWDPNVGQLETAERKVSLGLASAFVEVKV